MDLTFLLLPMLDSANMLQHAGYGPMAALEGDQPLMDSIDISSTQITSQHLMLIPVHVSVNPIRLKLSGSQ